MICFAVVLLQNFVTLTCFYILDLLKKTHFKIYHSSTQSTQNEKDDLNAQNKTSLIAISNFLKLLLAYVINWGNYLFWLSSKYVYHLFYFIPVPGSLLMFNVSVLIASAMYSTMAISTSGNQWEQWRWETGMNAFKKSFFFSLSLLPLKLSRNTSNCPSKIYYMI